MESEITPSPAETVRLLSSPLYNNKGWIKFFGIMNIIYGVFAAVTLVGILFAWIPIWLGVLINGAANNIERAYLTGNQQDMLQAQKKLSTYFVINAILVLLGLIFVGIILVVVFTTGLYTHMWQEMDNVRTF